ncbi:MAG: helix-turn-helix domain-containing protein [Anaerolineae bacterium]|nr:helix-turn-helix domain-containing protein [Anaerolineae bacterium]
MVLFDSYTDQSGVIFDDCLTAEAASRLTGYNIQHIRRLALSGTLDAHRVGRSWLIKLSSLKHYLNEVVPNGDGRFGPRRNCHSIEDLLD